MPPPDLSHEPCRLRTGSSQEWQLLAGAAADSCVAVGAGETKSYGALAGDVLALAERAERFTGQEVLVLCEDRYWLSVALLAAWQAGAIVALPPNHQAGTLAALTRDRSNDAVWRDQDEGSGIDVREMVGRAEARAPSRLRALRPEQPLVTLYTSGTTHGSAAWPKVARQLLGEAQMQVRYYALSSADRVVCTVPSRHIYGLLFGVLVPLSCGASFIRETELLAKGVAAKARLHDATLLVSTPAHLRALARLEQGALRPVRQIISSGAPLDRATGRQLSDRFGARVTEVLGSTETGGIAARPGDEDRPWQPLPGIQVSSDEVGRLVVQSPYLDDPARLHTCPDRIELGEEGTFEHLGRDDGVIKVGGKRVKLDEMEARVLALPGVKDAAALAESVEGLRAIEIRLAVVARGWSPEGVRRALAEFFDASVVPRRVRIVEALPRTENGKIRRRDLRAVLEAPLPERGAASAPEVD